MSTIFLDPGTWDLTLDVSGNIAVVGVAQGPAFAAYALAQSAANQIKLFQGEQYYDVTQGVPWWQQILGKLPPLSLVKAKLVEAALAVPGVVSAVVYISSFSNRVVSGQVQVTDALGNVAGANF